MTAERITLRNSYRLQWKYVRTLTSDKDLFGIEKLVLVAVMTGRFLLPSLHVNAIADTRPYPINKRVIDLYVAFKPLLLILFLCLGYGANPWVALLAAILLVDVYQFLIGAVLLSRPGLLARPHSPGRSLILAFINYVEVTLSFAVLYLAAHGVCRCGTSASLNSVSDWGLAIYFSMITSATVGYGDFVPCLRWGHVIATIHVFASLIFGASVLTVLVSRLSPPAGPTQEEERHMLRGA